MRAVAAYVYSAAGSGESTTDLAWDGQGMIHELGAELAESERFRDEPQLAIADVDVGRIRLERLRTPTFNDAAALAGHPETRFRRIAFDHRPHGGDVGLQRTDPPLSLRARTGPSCWIRIATRRSTSRSTASPSGSARPGRRRIW